MIPETLNEENLIDIEEYESPPSLTYRLDFTNRRIIGKIELTESFLVVGALCKATTIKIPKRDTYTHKHKILEHTTEPAGPDLHTHVINEFYSEDALPDILLWRGLQVGDEVYMIRFSDGQKYYVLQRKEGIT